MTRATIALPFLLLSACVPPPPGIHEVLKISDQGKFSLNGVSVPREQLRSAVGVEQRRVPTLFAEIAASPRSDMEDVKYVVDTLKAAQVRFAFIDEKIMNAGKTQAMVDSKPN